jgi:hypothetical protein
MNLMEILEPVTLYGGMADGVRLVVRACIGTICVPMMDARSWDLNELAELPTGVFAEQIYRRRATPGPDGYAAYDYEASSPIKYWTEG